MSRESRAHAKTGAGSRGPRSLSLSRIVVVFHFTGGVMISGSVMTPWRRHFPSFTI